MKSRKDHFDVVDLLLSHPQLDVNLATWDEDETALHFACKEDNADRC